MRLDMVEKTLEKVEESMKETHNKIHTLEDYKP
jgi:phage shock protein A